MLGTKTLSQTKAHTARFDRVYCPYGHPHLDAQAPKAIKIKHAGISIALWYATGPRAVKFYLKDARTCGLASSCLRECQAGRIGWRGDFMCLLLGEQALWRVEVGGEKEKGDDSHSWPFICSERQKRVIL